MEVIGMAYLIKAEDSLFSPIRLNGELYKAIFDAVSQRAKPFLKKITGKMIMKIVAGKEVALIGSKSIISLTVEIRAINLASQTAVACLVFPFWGKASEQEKVLQAIKFQAKVKGFYLNHCGLETVISLKDLAIEEVKLNNGNDNAQKYYRLKQ